MCRPPPAANPAPHAAHAPLRREGVAAGRAGESVVGATAPPIISGPGERGSAGMMC